MVYKGKHGVDMSNLEEAYSLEYNDIIDAEKAYELFWEEIISDKRAFQCTDHECNAQITCVNIDKVRADMKLKPHFKCFGVHSKDCEVIKEFSEKKEDRGKKENKKIIKYIDDKFDIFSSSRPKRDGIIANTKEHINKLNPKEEKKRIKNEYKENGRRNVTYYSIKPLISKFQKYSSENTLEEHFINIKGFNISYKKMFINIKDKDIETVEKYYRVYYGIGKIYIPKKNNDEFIIFFEEGFSKVKIKTAIYISNKIIDEHYRKDKWRKELKNLVEMKDKKIMFFINGKPEEKEKMIYLSILNMDFFDYRIIND